MTFEENSKAKRPIEMLGSPPRDLPFLLKAASLLGGINQFGWFFLGFGLIFVWLFVVHVDFKSTIYFRGELETVQGEITYSEKSGLSEGGSKHRPGIPIYANHYTFSANDGKKYDGVSYAVGTAFPGSMAVQVEYPKMNPSMSRIRNMRTAPCPPLVLFVLIFPIIGLGVIIFGLKKGFNAIDLLANGILAHGILKSKEQTGTRINGKYVFKLTFEFTANDGKTYEVLSRTNEPEVLEDDPTEPLIYRQYNPSHAAMMDTLPARGFLDIDPMGKINLKKGFFAALLFMIPLIVIFGHGAYIYLKFFK